MRWEEMPKGHTSVAELVKQFETHCRLEGKPETTCRWYREILNRFLEWAGDICLDEFTLEKVRGYLAYLKARPRYAGHPTTPSNGETVSAYTFTHHAVVLRVFASWLRDEGYTDKHRLERLKTPKVPETVVDILTAAEIRRVLESEPPNTPHGSRNHVMLVLTLDTGMRMSEITTLERRNLDLDRGILKAFGKGSRERVVPFGYTTTKALHRYVLHFRPHPVRWAEPLVGPRRLLRIVGRPVPPHHRRRAVPQQVRDGYSRFRLGGRDRYYRRGLQAWSDELLRWLGWCPSFMAGGW